MNENTDGFVSEGDRLWWQSKKFFAFLLAEVGFFALMGFMLHLQSIDQLSGNVAFMVLAITAGFLAVGFILGQAALDRYVRVALIAAGKKPPEKKPEDQAPEDSTASGSGEAQENPDA